MKKNAWTMAEMTVAVIILIVVALASVNLIKPNNSKSRIYVYATIKNLAKANAYLMERYSEIDSDSLPVIAGNDKFCTNFADVFSLDEEPNCSTSATVGDVNLKFSNGVTVQGLASAWVVPYTNASYAFKNIVIDIDGEEGSNKVGYDRFPLRIYKGDSFEGLIASVNCETDIFYEPETGTSHTLDYGSGKNPYCKNGFESNGSAKTNNFLMDNEVIAYDVYIPIEEEEVSKTKFIKSAQAPLIADCGAYGGSGFYTHFQCASAGAKLFEKCAQTDICETCKGDGYNICPEGTSDAETCKALIATNNPLDLSCFTYLRKPMSGLGVIAGSILGEVDM